jgi:hypothetical protein
MSATPKTEAATYDFSAKIPKYPDLKSPGEIKNVTAILNQTVTVPRRVGDVKGKAKVDVCHPKITNITFLFIQPSEHSTECWKLICRPAGSPPTGSTTPIEEGYQHGGETGGKGGYESGGSYPPDTSQKYPGETGGKGGYESGGSYPPDTSQKYPGETGGKGGYPKINPPPPPKYLAETECDFTWNNPDDPSEGGYYTVPNDPKDRSKGVHYIPYQGQQTQTTPPPAKTVGETLPPPQSHEQIPAPGSVAINLENDLFLIGHSVIRLLGAINTLEFENALDKEVSIQIVMGYPVDRPSIGSETGSKMQ